MKRILPLLLLIIIPVFSFAQRQRLSNKQFAPIADSIKAYLDDRAVTVSKLKVDTVYLYKNKSIDIHFTRGLSEYQIRDNDVDTIYHIAKSLMPKGFKKNKLHIFSSNTPLEELSSAYYSGRSFKRSAKHHNGDAAKWVTNASFPYTINQGLQESHIALWQSHGYYYEQNPGRWEWQRSRIFQTVEDIYTQSYVLPFLVPMLENAGACVVLPRERDPQIHEIILDNDPASYASPRYSGKYLESNGSHKWQTAGHPGFADIKEFYKSGENPFNAGSARLNKMIHFTNESIDDVATVAWIPKFPIAGEYAVYVSYVSFPNSTEAAEYIVSHNGGETKFIINQRIGGGTWVYLGTFGFSNAPGQGVILSNMTPADKHFTSGSVVVADAVKFGGGMGNILRRPEMHSFEDKQIADILSDKAAYSSKEAAIKSIVAKDSNIYYYQSSGYPRYTEGSRYWLQWAGFPDSVYNSHLNLNDYKDDYFSRGLWVNTLCDGYEVPLDMAFAFHTDAGTTPNDSIIGTLAIYSRNSNKILGQSCPIGDPRELADMVQTQIVDDIRLLYEPLWTRRGLWDRLYKETLEPVVPAMILELLSHQNFADMRYGLDPSFRFAVCRSVYKAILRYLSRCKGLDYTIQPLPVNSFFIEFQEPMEEGVESKQSVRLCWQPTYDPLEPLASPDKYVVYSRISSPCDTILYGGFDNGTVVEDTTCLFPIEQGKIYSFKVVAVNAGGASFPSEILSAGIPLKLSNTLHNMTDTLSTLSRNVFTSSFGNQNAVLIVNGFDRVAAPASFSTPDTSMAGFLNNLDSGVPYIRDYSFVGQQFEFNRKATWSDDDAPGFGASNADYETKMIAGNTFDYPLKHGIAFFNAGLPFVSCSRKSLDGPVQLIDYPIVDIIMGKQKQTQVGRDGSNPVKYEIFTPTFQKQISAYCRAGGNIIISGSNIGSEDSRFTREMLKYKLITHNASVSGTVKTVQNPLGIFNKSTGTIFTPQTMLFHAVPNEYSYHVEAPDGIGPTIDNAFTIFRYGDNNISAGVAYFGKDYRVVSLTFPIETLTSQYQINYLIYNILYSFK